jgi:type VI secretion system secreted protein VgrG
VVPLRLTRLTHFSLTAAAFRSIEGVSHDLQVLEFSGREAISQPFAFELELVSERPDLDLESLLHQAAFLAFDQTGHGIHGQIYRVAQGESGKRLTRYHVTLRAAVGVSGACAPTNASSST